MANSLLTIDMITREAVRLFKNSNLFVMNIDTQYDAAFAVDGAKIGSTLRIRLPNDYVPTRGPAMQLQDTTEQYTTLSVTDQVNIAVPFTTAERTMSLDDYAERVMAPLINNLAGEVAATVMEDAAVNAANFVSNTDAAGFTGPVAAGNIIQPTSDQFVLGNAVLDDNSADQMSRRMVADPTTDARTTITLQGLLNPATEISAQYRTGQMKAGLGYEKWFRDQTVVRHTSGTFSAGGTINGAGQTGTDVDVNATTGTLKQGDIVEIENVNAVNRVTKRSLQKRRQFVITSDAASGATSLNIYPAITPAVGGNAVQYQTVDASPANGAVLYLTTKSGEVYSRCLAYVQKAITMATADLVMPRKAVEEAARAQYDGIAMRVLTDYLPGTDQLATRVDVLFGSLTTRPEWVCVVAGKI